MCGISFVLNNDTYATNTDDFMKDSFLAGQVRGTDSAGLFLVDKEGKTQVRKMGVNASTFLDNRETRLLVDKIPNCKVAVGHVRAATVGYVSADNAHPFKANRADGSFIIGVHNGTLSNWKQKKDSKNYDVDSEWLFNMLATEGHDAFEYFNGAFALVWYDSNHPDSIFMARNDQRPLFYMVTDNGRSLLGCSELGMLGWLADRNKFKCSSQFPTPYYLSPGKIYKMSISDIGSYTTVDFPKYDPATTTGSSTAKTASTPSTYTPSPNVMGYPQYNSAWQEWDDDGYDSYYYEDSESVINKVKSALRNARYALVSDDVKADKKGEDGDSDIITGETLEHALMKALDKQSASREPKPKSSASVPWKPNALERGEIYLTGIDNLASTVTAAEQANAKSLGMFGMVVKFSGIWYDEELSVCMGTFDLAESGVINTYDGEIRGIPQSVADDVYINSSRDDGELCLVVGVHDTVEWIVVAPLTTSQKRFVNETLLEDHSKVVAN